MKIVFLSWTSAFGGGEKHLVDLIRRMDLSRDQPSILCFGVDPFTQPLNQRLQLGIEVRAGLSRTSFFQTRHALRRTKPDAVVFVTGTVGSYPWYLFLAARLSGAKSVSIVHHNFSDHLLPFSKNGNWFLYAARRIAGYQVRFVLSQKIITSMVDQSICVSENLRKELVEYFGYSPLKTVTVHNGVDLGFFATRDPSAPTVRSHLGVVPQDILIVSACRLVREKGVDILLRAISEVRDEVPGLKCIIVGDGPLRQEFEELSVELGLASTVFFAGYQENVRQYYQAGDIFANPSSPTWVECLPLSVLEAMASGLPCIASRAGGVPEIISDQEDGLLVTPGAVDELRLAIRRLATDHEERKRMGALAREKVRKQFDLERCVDQLKAILLR